MQVHTGHDEDLKLHAAVIYVGTVQAAVLVVELYPEPMMIMSICGDASNSAGYVAYALKLCVQGSYYPIMLEMPSWMQILKAVKFVATFSRTSEFGPFQRPFQSDQVLINVQGCMEFWWPLTLLRCVCRFHIMTMP